MRVTKALLPRYSLQHGKTVSENIWFRGPARATEGATV